MKETVTEEERKVFVSRAALIQKIGVFHTPVFDAAVFSFKCSL